MIITELKKIKVRVFIIPLFITALVSLTFVTVFGKKDFISIFVATYILLTDLYLLKINKKYSILLFIIAIPVLVTARKLCYFNFFIFRVTYETIYITALFIVCFNDIRYMIINGFKSADKKFKNLNILLLIMILFAYNSCSFSNNIFYSFGEIYIGLIAPIMFMLSVLVVIKKSDIKSLYYSLFTAMDLSCLYGFMQIVGLRIPAGKIIENREYITFGFNNINIFATIIITVIPVVLYSIIFKKNSIKEKIFLTASFILTSVSLLITYSRGAWICVIISIIIILFNKKYKKINLSIGILMILGLKPALSFILTRGTNFSLLKNTSTVARVQGMFTDLLIILKYPFGSGPATYSFMYKMYAVEGYKLIPESIRFKISAAPYALESAHNLFLTMWVELGTVCLMIFLVIIINRIAAVFDNYNENKGIFSAIISYLIISLLTGSELNHKGIITGTLILFLYFGIIEINRRKIDDQ